MYVAKSVLVAVAHLAARKLADLRRLPPLLLRRGRQLQIVLCPIQGIRQRVVRGTEQLEVLLSLRIALVLVRMELLCQRPVGFLDRIRRSRAF